MGAVKRLSIVSAVCFTVLATSALGAGSWVFGVSPYLWVSHVSGTTVVNGLESEFDMSAGDMFKFVDFALMVHGETWRGRLGLTTDVMYVNLGEDVRMTYETAGVDVTIDSDQVFWEFGGGYLLLGEPYAFKYEASSRPALLSLEALGGIRYVHMGISLDFVVDPGVEGAEKIAGKKEATKSWFEPYFGARIPIRATDKLSFPIRGDIAGFGAGSELTWNVIFGADYRITKHISLGGGYRILDIRYEEGTSTERFAYNARMAGPGAYATFAF